MAYRSVATIVALSCAALSGQSLADPSNLAGDELKGAIAGKTVALQTPVGVIPITYRPNGSMIGIARNMQAYTGQERDRGTWWISGPQLCQRWETWLEGRPYCFTLRMAGPVVHWRRSDGQVGIATIQPATIPTRATAGR